MRSTFTRPSSGIAAASSSASATEHIAATVGPLPDSH
eukprot:gene56160-74992_t